MEKGGKFQLDVVKPDGAVLSAAVDETVIPGLEGFFGVLPGHAPFLTLLGTGEMWYRIDSARRYLALSGGFCEVRPDRVTVLAESAERAEDIDLARAERALERARAHSASAIQTTDLEEMEKARIALERATVRVAVASRRAEVNP